MDNEGEDHNGLDADDRFLIRTLASKGLNKSAIAQKRLLDEKVISEVLQEYWVKGNQNFKQKKFRAAAFYYKQHQTYVLGGKECLKADFAVKKAEKRFPSFGKFLDENRSTFVDGYSFENVTQLWKQSFRKYQGDEGFRPEARINERGGGLVSVEEEEQQMDATCQIQDKNKSAKGAGVFIELGGILGVVTDSNILSRQQANSCSAFFETMEDETARYNLQPEKCFLSNKDLGVSFVACEPSNGQTKIAPWKIFNSADENDNLNCYCFVKDDEDSTYEKALIHGKVTEKKEEMVVFDASEAPGITIAKGGPVFLGRELVAINQSSEDTSVGVCMKKIQDWVEKSRKDGVGSNSSGGFKVGDEVKARWTDGYEYNARIVGKTETGWKVHYYEFGDTSKFDQEESSISSIHTNTTSQESKSDSQESYKKEPEEKEEPFNEETFKEVAAWLKSMELERYIKPFREQKYDSMNKIKKWKSSEREKKLLAAGCKAGSVVKLQKNISVLIAYGDDYLKTPGAMSNVKKNNITIPSKPKKKIKEIRNNPMPDNWTPSGQDLDLTEEFTDHNGSSSVSKSCQEILKGHLVQGMTQGEDCTFYLKSTRYNRYFLITVLYQ